MDIFANEYTKKLSLVYLISDFQNGSFKTGLMKSVWMNALPSVSVIDITHEVRLNNLIEAAFIAQQLETHPSEKQAVHIKVGNTRESVVYAKKNLLYILPNNGLIGMLSDSVQSDNVYLCASGAEPQAFELFLNNRLQELQRADERLQIRYARQANFHTDMATAECIYADRLGNCYFNIRKDQFEAFTSSRIFHIRIQHYLGVEFKKLVESIRDANPGEAIFRFSKSGYLMLQIHQGNAKQLFRIKDDTKIIIELQ